MTEHSLTSMREMKMYTTDGLTVGTVKAFELDTILWKVRSLVVEVDDGAMEPLGLKKTLMRRSEIQVGKELPRRAQLMGLGAVGGDDGRSLGEAVPLVHGDSQGEEEALHLDIEVGSTPDEVFHLTSEVLPDLGEEDPVVQRVERRPKGP